MFYCVMPVGAIREKGANVLLCNACTVGTIRE